MTVAAREGVIRVVNTHIGVWEDGYNEEIRAAMHRAYHGVRARLRSHGWHWLVSDIIADRVRRRRSAADWHVGTRGPIGCATNTGGRMAQWDFYQTSRFDNVNGAQYCFKAKNFRQMTAHEQLCVLVAMGQTIEKLVELGYRPDGETLLAWDGSAGERLATLRRIVTAEDAQLTPLAAFNKGWTASRFRRDASGWPAREECSGSGYTWRDRDGAPIEPGSERYAYVRGRLMRGRIYPTMNGGWLMRYGDGGGLGGQIEWHVYEQSMFLCDDPGALPSRLVPGQAKRLAEECKKALDAGDFGRLARVAAARDRLTAAQSMPAKARGAA